MTEKFTNVRSMLDGLTRAMNLINPEVENHHQQTAYFAFFIGRAMGFEEEMLHQTIYAALLHDVGSIAMEQPASIHDIEAEAARYAAIGADMLADLPDFEETARIIRFCQTDYSDMAPAMKEHPEWEPYFRIAGAIHVADAASLLLKSGQPVLNQVEGICGLMEQGKGKNFLPEAVEGLLSLRKLEVIWLDALNNPSFLGFFTGIMHEIGPERVASLTRLMSRIIDYRSSFTAMHSAGVAASAKAIARLAGMNETDCLKMEIAGNLHDVGKLVVPASILVKPGKLTAEEFNIIKEHPYYTRWVLMNMDGFEQIANWAAFHHEKLTGDGYPFHLGAADLDLGSRIMAVADIFSAIAEERPYRKGMTREQAEGVLRDNVARGAICGDVVELLFAHYSEVDEQRDAASRREGQRYFQSVQ